MNRVASALCALLASTASLLSGCADRDDRLSAAQAEEIVQVSFATPEDLVVAFVDAARDGDIERVRPLFGPRILEIESDSPERTEGDLQRFAAAYDRGHALFIDDAAQGAFTLAVGFDLWEFPVPIVREGDRYRFDTDVGVERVRELRVEANERDAVDFLIGCVAAQEEFRRIAGPGYAQRFRSSPGARDGLWWPDELGPPRSPLGPMTDDPRVAERASADAAFLGYRYRILTRAGAFAPEGATNWLDAQGRLLGGFAFLAWPDEYGESGRRTFLVSMRGEVWGRDFGVDAAPEALAIEAFDPGEGWVRDAPR